MRYKMLDMRHKMLANKFLMLAGIRFLLLAMVLFTFSACKKEKVDFSYDHRDVTQAQQSSNVRLVNLAGFSQLIVNGDSLTNFVVLDPNGPRPYEYPGTRYFPTNGLLSKIWSVPQDLFNAQEEADFDLAIRSFDGLNDQDFRFSASNSYDTPMDYYLLNTIDVSGIPKVLPVERDVTSPAKPDHFKIRIINLTGEIANLASNTSGVQELLHGTTTLTYADGTPVSPKTSDITTDNRVSAYVEIPYGTYQFKVLTEDGRQFPAATSSADPYSYRLLDPPTSTLAIGISETTNLVFTPTQTYMPGGIYTVVVTPKQFEYYSNEMGETVGFMQNAIDVITDNTPSANVSYFRMQGINALDNEPIKFIANGKALPGDLNFGEAGEYGTFVHGIYRVEAVDRMGKIVASVEQELRAGQNYTAWLYHHPSGENRLLLLSNDMSGMQYRSTSQGFPGSVIDDATYNRFHFRFPFNKRFLNLSSDNAHITFTQNDGQTFSDGSEGSPDVNLRPGVPIVQYPYIRSSPSAAPYELLVFRSAPDVVPGTWAQDIPIRNNSDFIADKDLYRKVGRMVPVHESGIYTVALIGGTGDSVPAALKAKVIIVKHNK